MPVYPAIEFVLRHRQRIPVAALLLTVLAGLWLTLRTGWPEMLPAAAIAGGGLYLAAKVGIELVALISDMLLPK